MCDLLTGAAVSTATGRPPDAGDAFRQKRVELWRKLMETYRYDENVESWRGALEGMQAEAAHLLNEDGPASPRRPFHWPVEFPEVFVERSGFDALVGNPPFIGGQKITGALGTRYRDYLVGFVAAGTRGSADLCAYFFLRGYNLLVPHSGFGLLATNTIAQGDTREVGLDRLVASGGVIHRAVPSRKWPGQANLEVAHVWLRRGKWQGNYVLDDNPATGISPQLALPGSVSGKPFRLIANAGKSFQGSNILGLGFTMSSEEAERLIAEDPRNRDVLFPYLNGEDLNSRPDQSPSRWAINFHDWPIERAMEYPDCFRLVDAKVRPERERNNRKVRRERWWQFAERASDLYATIVCLPRVLVVSLVTHHVGIASVPTGMVYAHKLAVFSFDRADALARLQSNLHEPWARAHSSSLETRMNYSPSDCFETFPFPERLARLASIGERYQARRQRIMLERQQGLTATYNRFHNREDRSADIEQLRQLHVEMDRAVAAAYGWDDLDLGHGFHTTKQGERFTISEIARRTVLERLLALNHERYHAEVAAGLHEKGAKGEEAPQERNPRPRNAVLIPR
jgi:hypothetical protein